MDVDDWAVTGQALDDLYETGYLFAYELFGGQAQLQDFQAYASRLLALSDPMTSPAFVDISAPEDVYFPFELLPVLGDVPDDPATRDDVIAAPRCSRGWPPSSVAQRSARRLRRVPSYKLAMSPKLPVRLFRYGRLERELFGRTEGDLEVRGSWPDGPLGQKEAIKTFARLVFDAGAVDEDGEDQIHHFACHCETGTGPARTWKIQLAPEDKSDQIELSLKDLIIERGRRGSIRSATRPLVFMNACASAAIDPTSILSLPKLFLENHNCAYIGTETRIVGGTG